jgi:hypothetical protein
MDTMLEQIALATKQEVLNIALEYQMELEARAFSSYSVVIL